MRGPHLSFLIWLIFAVFPAEAQLGESARRGKRIYHTGQSPSGKEIAALMGETGTEVPAGVLPCVSCHGPDGRGRPEGGVYPSDITWTTLTKPYEVRTPTGRTRGPYDESLLKSAVALGLDSKGQALDGTMPRYRMSEADMDDLVAYIKMLGLEETPGVGDEKVVVGVLLPPHGTPWREVMRASLEAWFADLGERGGIYGRRIALRWSDPGPDPDARVGLLREMMEGGEVFALLAPFAVGIEQELDRMASASGVPVIGPIAALPVTGFPPTRQVFYLGPGPGDQARALFRYAAKNHEQPPSLAVVHPGDDAAMRKALEAIEDLNAQRQWPPAHVFSTLDSGSGPVVLAEHLRDLGVDLVFFLGLGEPGRDFAFFNGAAELGWFPELYLLGHQVGIGGHPAWPRFAARSYFAFSLIPEDLSRSGSRRYERLKQRFDFPENPGASWLTVLGAASLFEHGLQAAGRQLTRNRLVDVLEKLYRWPTGFTPPLSYNPNRRIGARGAYIVTVDPQRKTIKPVSDWVEAEPSTELPR